MQTYTQLYFRDKFLQIITLLRIGTCIEEGLTLQLVSYNELIRAELSDNKFWKLNPARTLLMFTACGSYIFCPLINCVLVHLDA